MAWFESMQTVQLIKIHVIADCTAEYIRLQSMQTSHSVCRSSFESSQTCQPRLTADPDGLFALVSSFTSSQTVQFLHL